MTTATNNSIEQPSVTSNIVLTPFTAAPVSSASSKGVASTPDTIQSAAPAATTRFKARVKGFYAQICGVIKGVADIVRHVVTSFFIKVKNWFVKARTTVQEKLVAAKPVSTHASTTKVTVTEKVEQTSSGSHLPPISPEALAEAAAARSLENLSIRLEVFKTAVDDGNMDRDEAVLQFSALPEELRTAIKAAMWTLAGNDIDDENDLQPYERQNTDDWAGRVIRNEVQLAGEEEQQDIKRYTDILAQDSLFRRAIDKVFQEKTYN